MLPEYVVAVYTAFKEGNLAKAEEANNKLKGLRSITASASNAVHASIKEGMKARGIPIESIVKPPLPLLTEEQKMQIRQNVKAAGLLNTA
jgi:dihydrodipicolinate synthase/N-acetylneuraminate lyase